MRLAARTAGLLLIAIATGACAGKPAAAPTTPSPPQQEAISRMGDVTIRANAIPTYSLAEQVAREYKITRDTNTVMLLVGARQGSEAQEVALPAQVTATATGLGGQPRAIAMRELRSGDLLDYVGTLPVSPPDTLRFDVTIVRANGARSTMQFTREFFPQ